MENSPSNVIPIRTFFENKQRKVGKIPAHFSPFTKNKNLFIIFISNSEGWCREKKGKQQEDVSQGDLLLRHCLKEESQLRCLSEAEGLALEKMKASNLAVW